jgi:hypothetical protein
VIRVRRSGIYYRVCKVDWLDCLDTSYSRTHGGRWNAAGAFGVLYLNRTVDVAVARVGTMFESNEATVFDLRPERRPELLEVEASEVEAADAVSREGLASLGLPAEYPFGVGNELCQPVGQHVYEDESAAGIACRSAAGCRGPGDSPGEELALFERATDGIRPGVRRTFAEWYPQG